MPLSGQILARSSDTPAYFTSLEELDIWSVKTPPKLTGIVPYRPRHASTTQGKLLVCHDYKGGYKETPFRVSYTFNFWSMCDTFVYFSHHRVTIPPPGWINVAHRQGTKILGTLIFEPPTGGGDILRLLVGRLPTSTTAPAASNSNGGSTFPLSAHYARILALLALQRGFDGYLLNVEVELVGKVEQTRALAAWISILNAEMKKVVGNHAQTIWYDSVVVTGQLAWQDRLNTFNLPFFLPSTSIFTNYTWGETYPKLTAAYLHRLNQKTPTCQHKSLADIFVGIDVWGRGTYGGGGLGCFRALGLIAPDCSRDQNGQVNDKESVNAGTTPGLSVALFGQAWTWESTQDDKDFTWSSWWAYERLLWLGPALTGAHVDVPKPPQRKNQPECPEGVFKPIQAWFSTDNRKGAGAALDPYSTGISFHTNFCPGVGWTWFVSGKRVVNATKDGWTDVDKQSSLGDLVWPRPVLAWETASEDEQPDVAVSTHQEQQRVLPMASTQLDFDDAWNGGSSLRLNLQSPVTLTVVSDEAESAFQCVWLPVQSIEITSGVSYDAVLVYKLGPLGADDNVDVDIGVSVKQLFTPDGQVEIMPSESLHAVEQNGWTRLGVQFVVPTSADRDNEDAVIALGLVLSIIINDTSIPWTFDVFLGQMNVYPSPAVGISSVHHPTVLWADFKPRSSVNSTPPASSPSSTSKHLPGLLTWDVAAAFHPLTNVHIDPSNPESTTPTWTLNPSPTWFPTFLYFNIYAQVLHHDSPSSENGSSNVVLPENAVWIGTSGLDGDAHAFAVQWESVLSSQGMLEETKGVRYYVQGVTDRGDVLGWDKCVYVTVVSTVNNY